MVSSDFLGFLRGVPWDTVGGVPRGSRGVSLGTHGVQGVGGVGGGAGGNRPGGDDRCAEAAVMLEVETR